MATNASSTTPAQTLLQQAAVLGGLPPSDAPANVPEMFQVLVGAWQEAVPGDRLPLYNGMVRAISAVSPGGNDTKRAWRSIDWLVRTFIASYTELIGWPDEAVKLKALAPIENREGLQAAMPSIRDVTLRARLLVEAAQSLRHPVNAKAGGFLERRVRARYGCMFRAMGRATTEVEDARAYVGYAALAHTGLRSLNALVRWQPLQGVRCPELAPTLACAEELQTAANMGVDKARTDALTLWLCDSFAALVAELAVGRKEPAKAKRPRKPTEPVVEPRKKRAKKPSADSSA
jgi:hypothetical protein